MVSAVVHTNNFPVSCSECLEGWLAGSWVVAFSLFLLLGTLAPGAPSASLPRSGRSAPSLRPLRSVASGARLARFGRSARSRIEPSARSLHGPWLWSSCCSLASLAHSTRSCSHGPCRSLAPRLYALPRLAPSARSPRALRSLAPRPSLGRSAASARSLGALRALRSLVCFIIYSPSTATRRCTLSKHI